MPSKNEQMNNLWFAFLETSWPSLKTISTYDDLYTSSWWQIFAGFMLKSTLPMTKNFFLTTWAIAKLVSDVNYVMCFKCFASLFDCAVDHSQDLMLLMTIQWISEIFCGLPHCHVILRTDGCHQVSILFVLYHYVLCIKIDSHLSELNLLILLARSFQLLRLCDKSFFFSWKDKRLFY